MKKLHEISNLIDVYGLVITKNQFECLNYFYFQDWSLSEIAQYKKTTRSAIFNCIKRATNKLFDLEEKLKIVNKKNQRLKIYENIKEQELLKKLIDLEKD